MAAVHYGRLNGPAGFARTVAIKRLHPHHAREPEFVSMFLDEARLAARVRHPNVVPTLDVVDTDGEIFLVMEYVQGESLARLTRSVRAMMTSADTRIVSTIMSGVLHGLHAAHEARSEQGEPLDIVHRDVSPQNILVGVDGVARVLDFGVAKAAGRLQATRDGQIKGKLAYMAPEQLHGARITRQTDVYSAAVVIWETLTGRRLFLGDNEGAVVTAILQMPLKAPSHVAPHVPFAFDRVVMRGLERDVTRRYATAREMALDLERCAGIASASEVGEWVESLAHDELLKRASCVAEIESVSTLSPRSVSMPSAEDMPTVLTASASVPNSQRPAGPSEESTVAPILTTEPRRQTHRLAIVASAGGAIALAALLVVIVHGGSAPRTGAAPAAAPLAPSLESPSAPELAGAAASSPAASSLAMAGAPEGAGTNIAPGLQTVSPSSLPAASTKPPARSPPTAWRRPAPVPVPTSTMPMPPPRQPAVVDCDPPFTIDDKGHKHYKPACLQ
jgi:serine/threonine-protein kinase